MEISTFDSLAPSFDAARPIAVKLPPSGTKTVHLKHFPTDADWIAYFLRAKMIKTDLGRGASTTDQNRALAASLSKRLVDSLQVEETSIDLSEAEASYVRSKLGECDVTDVERQGDDCRVTLRVLGVVETAIVLHGPSCDDIDCYRRNLVKSVDRNHGKTELAINLQSALDAYALLKVSTEGYVGEPPVIHMNAAISAAIAEIERGLMDDSGN